MNHFKVFQNMPGKCDMCGEAGKVFAKLSVDGKAVHPWRICQKCLESTSQLMKLVYDSDENLEAAMKMQI